MDACIYAVIVNWNGGSADNIQCIDSLIADGLKPERIVFVDNASSDGSLESVRERWPALILQLNSANLGYGEGSNQGMQLALDAGAEALYLVNNDVSFPKGTLARLWQELQAGKSQRLGIVGPRVVYRQEPDMIWCAGGKLTYRQNLSQMIGHRQHDGPRFQKNIDVDYVPGCALLVSREVLESIGLLQADYFAYHEDVEFCMQAKEAGFGVRMVGEALAFHDAHHSTGGGYNARRKYMMGLNTVWFLRKHGTPLRWLSFLFFDVLSLPLVWLLRAPRGEGGAVLAKARGTWHGLLGRRVTADAVEPRV